jgi:WD40 repeat protein
MKMHPGKFYFAFALFLLPLAAQSTELPIPIAQLTRDTAVDFETEILPVFQRNCLACHSATQSKSDLNLETPATILKGGESGPALIPGHGHSSLLLQLAARQTSPFMPPAKNSSGALPLTPEELGLLKLWIDQGATGAIRKSISDPLPWQPLPTSVNPIYAAAISSDGQYAACGRANQIFTYHLPSGQCVALLTDPSLPNPDTPSGAAHLDLVQSLAFSPDGLLASGGFRTVKLWRRPDPQPHLEWTDPGTKIIAAAQGEWFAAGTTNGSITLWNIRDYASSRTLTGHAAAITALKFSREFLVSGSLDHTIRIWNPADGSLLHKITSDLPILSMAVLEQENQIAASSPGPIIRIWPLSPSSDSESEPMPPRELDSQNGPVTSLTSLHPGNLLIAGTETGAIQVWNTSTLALIKQFPQNEPALALAAAPGGPFFASAGKSGATIWSLESDEPVASLKGNLFHDQKLDRLNRAIAVAQSTLQIKKNLQVEAEKNWSTQQEASKTAAANKIKTAKALERKQLELDQSARAKQTAEAHLNLIKCTESMPDSLPDAEAELKKISEEFDKIQKALAAARIASTQAEEETLLLLRNAQGAAQELLHAQAAVAIAETTLQELGTDLQLAQSFPPPSPIRALAFSPDSKRLAALHDDHIQIWHPASGKGLQLLHSPQFSGAITFTSDTLLATGSAPDKIISWNLEPSWILEKTIGHPDDPAILVDRVTALAFSPNGKFLATGSGEPSRGGELKIWNVETGSLALTIPDAHSDTPLGLEFSRDNQFLASAAADRFVKIFQLPEGRLVRAFEGHLHHVLDVSWRADGHLLASAGADKTVRTWDVTSGKQIKSITDFEKEVTSIQFVAESNEALVSSSDQKIRLLREDGHLIRPFNGATGFIYAAAASSDGKWIIAGGLDSILRVWNGATGELLHTFPPKIHP